MQHSELGIVILPYGMMFSITCGSVWMSHHFSLARASDICLWSNVCLTTSQSQKILDKLKSPRADGKNPQLCWDKFFSCVTLVGSSGCNDVVVSTRDSALAANAISRVDATTALQPLHPTSVT